MVYVTEISGNVTSYKTTEELAVVNQVICRKIIFVKLFHPSRQKMFLEEEISCLRKWWNKWSGFAKMDLFKHWGRSWSELGDSNRQSVEKNSWVFKVHRLACRRTCREHIAAGIEAGEKRRATVRKNEWWNCRESIDSMHLQKEPHHSIALLHLPLDGVWDSTLQRNVHYSRRDVRWR